MSGVSPGARQRVVHELAQEFAHYTAHRVGEATRDLPRDFSRSGETRHICRDQWSFRGSLSNVARDLGIRGSDIDTLCAQMSLRLPTSMHWASGAHGASRVYREILSCTVTSGLMGTPGRLGVLGRTGGDSYWTVPCSLNTQRRGWGTALRHPDMHQAALSPTGWKPICVHASGVRTVSESGRSHRNGLLWTPWAPTRICGHAQIQGLGCCIRAQGQQLGMLLAWVVAGTSPEILVGCISFS